MPRAQTRGTLMVKFLLLLIVLLVGGAAFLVLARPNTSTVNVLLPSAQPPSANVQTSPPERQAAAPPTAAAGEIAVKVDEATLAQHINASVANKPLGETPLGTATARDFAVQLQNGQMRTTGTAQVGSTTLPLSVDSVVSVEGGRPVVDVRDAKLGAFPLPDGARQEMQRTIQAQLDQALNRQQFQVRSVSIGDGTLTLVGVPR